MELMLLDAASLQEKDAEWKYKWRARMGKRPISTQYTTADAEQALSQRRPLLYDESREVAKGVHVTFHDAGHILGSAIVEIEVPDHHLTRRLMFSGDLGNTCSPLMHDPAILKRADVVLLESTYGDRDHRCSEDTLDELAEILQQPHRNGRTQNLIYYFSRFYHAGRLPQQSVFLDSPMAIRANVIYCRYQDQFAAEDRTAFQARGSTRIEDWLPTLRCTATAEESMTIHRIKSGAIIIAGSGMCTDGRIAPHFKHNLWRDDCHLIFPGFLAKGTLGRALADGAEHVKLLHQRMAVNAKTHTLGGFSAHAGQSLLINWVSHFEHHHELYLAHSELEKMQTLHWPARAPELDRQHP